MSFQKQDQPTNTQESHQLNELQTHQQEQQFLENSSEVSDQIQISEEDQSLNVNEFNQPNQQDIDFLYDHQQIDDQEDNKSDPIYIFTEGSGHGNLYKKQWTKPVQNDAQMEKALIPSLESLYKNKAPRQIGDYVMKQDINPSSVYRNDSRIRVICKYNQNEQKVSIEINDIIIYDPIKCQIYLTYARGKPERNRPERKRKMISKIVETRSLNYE
ncbi:hypothetical protein pb186bvf_016250 [Paramecium bursaria]